MKTSPVLLPTLLAAMTFALPLGAAEVEIDLTKAPTVYAAEGAACESGPDESGSGIKMTYSFENSRLDWVHYQLGIPAIDAPIKKITVIARGTATPMTAIMFRDSQNKPISFRFGPLSEDDFQTYEIDPTADKAPEIGYPIEKASFQIKSKPGNTGFLEVSKVIVETE